MVRVTFHGWLLHLWVLQQASWELVIKLVRNKPGKEYMIYNEYLAIIEWRGAARMWRILQIGEDVIDRGG